jgi:YihY family inner membrane protein
LYLVEAFGKSITGFIRDEGFYLAASISYFLIVALVPLSLLIVSLFGHLLGHNQEFYQYALTRLVSSFPSVTSGITNELRNIITFKGISLITLFIYAFLSLQLFYSIEHAMNVIFKVPKRRHFLLSLFWSVFIIMLLIIFLLLSFTVSSVAGVFKGIPVSMLGVEIGYKAGIFVGYIAPFLLVLATFTAIYLIIPTVRVSLRNAFFGSMLVTILWELAKHFFTWYVKNVIHFGAIYGSLTTFILFLLWVYYLSIIFLFGGEFVNNLNRRI